MIATLRVVLGEHNPLEEHPGGLYETCEKIAGNEVDVILASLRAAPEVPGAPHVDGPKVLAAARRALARAGLEVEALPLTRHE